MHHKLHVNFPHEHFIRMIASANVILVSKCLALKISGKKTTYRAPIEMRKIALLAKH